MKILKFFLFSFFLLIFLGSLISLANAATVGMGVRWYKESAIVEEGKQNCIEYGLYNPTPWEVPVYGYLEATGDLEKIYVKNDPMLVPVNTSSDHAINKQICFNIPKVYGESCILGAFCERTCPEHTATYEKEVRLKGEVIGMYTYNSAEFGGGTGSTTGTSVAVPLELAISCQPEERNQVAFYATIVVIIVAIILIIWLLTRKPKKQKK